MADDRDTAGKSRSMKILATDANYPKYELEFDGELVADPITIRGPHSFQLHSAAPDVNVKVLVSHKDADPGVPNLRITIRRTDSR